MFDYEWIQNKYPVVGLVIWYLFIFILGLAVYPIVRLAMPGLADKGYPLSRALGLVVLGYFSWISGSVGIPVTRPTVVIVLGLVLIIGGALAWYQRDELAKSGKQNANTSWRSRSCSSFSSSLICSSASVTDDSRQGLVHDPSPLWSAGAVVQQDVAARQIELQP